jgi:hypothetical protein
MPEAKAEDLALRRLRRDISTCAPDVAIRFGLTSRSSGERRFEPNSGDE